MTTQVCFCIFGITRGVEARSYPDAPAPPCDMMPLGVSGVVVPQVTNKNIILRALEQDNHSDAAPNFSVISPMTLAPANYPWAAPANREKA